MSFRSTPERLGDDVFAHIFSLSPISAVLAASQTCKRLNAIAASRQTWLSLATNLYARGMLDLYPDQRLQDLSKNELIELCKRTQAGPQWSVKRPEDIKVVHRATVTLPEDKRETIPVTSMDIQAWAQAFLQRPPRAEDSPRNQSPVKMIPGGRHFIYRKSAYKVQVFDVHEGTLVWTYHSSWPDCGVKEFAFQLANNGQGVEMVFTLYGGSDSLRAQFVEVIYLDLETMVSKSLYEAKIPKAEKTGFFVQPVMLGNEVIIESNLPEYCYVVNLQSKTFGVLDVATLNRYKLALVPGILISLEIMSGLETLRITLHDIAKSRPSQDAQSDIGGLRTILSQIIKIDPSSQGLPRLQLSVRANPIHHEVYQIWIVAAFVNRVTGIFKFKLTLPSCPGTIPCLQPIATQWSKLPDLDLPSAFDISYHGHVVLFDMLGGQPSMLSLQDLLEDEEHPQWLDTSNARRRAHLTAYSGALVHGDIQDYEGRLEAEFYA